MVILGTQFWVRNVGDEVWEELPADFMEQAGLAPDFQEQAEAVFEFLIDPVLNGERVVDGEAVYEIETAVSEELFSVMLAEDMADQFFAVAEDVEMSLVMWVTQDNFFIPFQELTMTMTVEGEPLSIVNQSIVSNINEPVTIPDPTAE